MYGTEGNGMDWLDCNAMEWNGMYVRHVYVYVYVYMCMYM